jgi:hypothetical protein
MEHIGFLSMLMMVFIGRYHNIIKRNTAILDASKEVDLEVNAEKT